MFNEYTAKIQILSEEEIKKLFFEDALKKLDEIIKALNDDAIPLEEAVRYHDYAMKLYNVCNARLKDAMLRIEKVIKGEDGMAASSEDVQSKL